MTSLSPGCKIRPLLPMGSQSTEPTVLGPQGCPLWQDRSTSHPLHWELLWFPGAEFWAGWGWTVWWGHLASDCVCVHTREGGHSLVVSGVSLGCKARSGGGAGGSLFPLWTIPERGI